MMMMSHRRHHRPRQRCFRHRRPPRHCFRSRRPLRHQQAPLPQQQTTAHPRHQPPRRVLQLLREGQALLQRPRQWLTRRLAVAAGVQRRSEQRWRLTRLRQRCAGVPAVAVRPAPPLPSAWVPTRRKVISGGWGLWVGGGYVAGGGEHRHGGGEGTYEAADGGTAPPAAGARPFSFSLPPITLAYAPLIFAAAAATVPSQVCRCC